MNRYQAKKIARLAYGDIRAVVDAWESENDCVFGIHCNWDGCITVGDEHFSECELRDYEECSD